MRDFSVAKTKMFQIHVTEIFENTSISLHCFWNLRDHLLHEFALQAQNT